jgi:hypothetical protein
MGVIRLLCSAVKIEFVNNVGTKFSFTYIIILLKNIISYHKITCGRYNTECKYNMKYDAYVILTD